MKALGRGVRTFGRFWWDFLVGETPEISLAVVAVVVAALLLRDHSTAGVVVLPALAIAVLLTTVMVGRNRR